MRVTRQLTTLRALCFHNDWAREKLLDAASPLADDALDDPAEMGPGSLRATIEHLWRTERGWLDVWQGAADSRPPPEPAISIAELRSRFRATAAERETLLDDRDEAEQIACTTETGHSLRMALADMVLHVCNHGFHHRAQTLNMLRRIGVEGPEIDYLHMSMDPSVTIAVSYEPDLIGAY